MKNLILKQISKKFKKSTSVPQWLRSLGPWWKQLKIIREALGMSQGFLAKRIKSQQHLISRIEQNEANPTIKTLEKIAAAINCELFIGFVPKEELFDYVSRLAEAKAEAIVSQSIASADLEEQSPQKSAIYEVKEELKKDFMEKDRKKLWMS